jgi:hypothetical protein
MTPLDDELRSMFRNRAGTVAPAPDPLGGIEQRAKRMRRNRVGASVAGAALAVAAIAVAVPSLVPDREAGQVATTPTPSASPGPDLPPTALNPLSPWAYRGDDLSLLGPGTLDTIKREYGSKHGATSIELTPLYGKVYGPSQQFELVFLADVTAADGVGQYFWGVSTTPTDAGPVFLADEPLAEPALALMAALPGDAAARLLVVAAPGSGAVEYASDGENFRDIQIKLMVEQFGSPSTQVETTTGIGLTALVGDTSKDVVRVLDGQGGLAHPIFEGPAPDYAGPTSTTDTTKPGNYVEWQTRGAVDARTESQAVSAFAQAKGTTDNQVGHHVLWGGTDKSGRNLVFMEAWVHGQQAQTFGFVSTGEPFLGPVIGKTPDVLAYLASGAPGTGTDVLVILPRLGAGPFSYATSATAPYRQVGNARSDLENVAVIDRDPKATSDRLKVLDGDGMKVLYDGAVQPLLCGASGCG